MDLYGDLSNHFYSIITDKDIDELIQLMIDTDPEGNY